MGKDDPNSASGSEAPPASECPPIRSPVSTMEVMEAGMNSLCEALESYSEGNTSSSNTKEHLFRTLGFVEEAIQRIDRLDTRTSPQRLSPSIGNPFYREGIGNTPRKMNKSAPSKNKSTPRKLRYADHIPAGYIYRGSNSPPTPLERTVRAIGRLHPSTLSHSSRCNTATHSSTTLSSQPEEEDPKQEEAGKEKEK